MIFTQSLYLLRPSSKINKKAGVTVVSVAPTSPFAQTGTDDSGSASRAMDRRGEISAKLRPGDEILEVNGVETKKLGAKLVARMLMDLGVRSH